MTSTDFEASIAGAWVTTTSPNLRWDGVIRTGAPYALLLVARLPTMTVWAKSRSRGTADLPVGFHVHSLGADDQTQLMFKAGDGWIQNVLVRSAGLPRFCAPQQLDPGLLHPIFIVDSDPIVSFGMMLLRRSEVSVGKTGVWRLRKPREDLSTDLIALSNGGRTGTIAHD